MFAVPLAAVLAWVLARALILNLGHLYLRDLMMGSAPASLPWIVSERPLVGRSAAAVWLDARIARLRGAASRGSEGAIAAAYVDRRIRPHTRMEAELVAWSCIAAEAGDACRARLRREQPEVAAALSAGGVVSAEYVEELNGASGENLAAALTSGTVDCPRALDFIRSWVTRSGFRAGQLPAARALAAACPSQAEAQFYRARAADLSDLAGEADAAYAASRPAEHEESAFWYADFQARRGAPPVHPSSAGARRRWFGAAAIAARFEDGSVMESDTIVADAEAPGGRARRAARFGAILAYGPYIRLPYGRYRVGVFVRTSAASGAGRAARIDVREDTTSWRPYLWSRVVGGDRLPGYRRVVHEFTSTGEGSFSIAVVSLTTNPVSFAGVELERVGG